MAIAFVNIAASATAGGTVTQSVPPGVVDGNLLLWAAIQVNSGTSISTPTGWAVLDTSGGNPNIRLFYRIASSEPASYNLGLAGPSLSTMTAYSGVDTSTPFNQTSLANPNSYPTGTLTGFTTTADGCLLVIVQSMNTSTASGISTDTATGFTQRLLWKSGSIFGSQWVADEAQASAGATGNPSYTMSGTGAVGGIGTFLALNPILSAPANSAAPVVSGSASVGSILSVTNGTWSGTTPITFTYQWTRDGSNIATATASTYTTVSADVGHAIGCTVTATNAKSSANQASSNTITVSSANSGFFTLMGRP